MTISSGNVTAAQPRMTGRVRAVALPLMRSAPDTGAYVEHRTADGRRIFVARQVLRDLDDLERSYHPEETAGLLFGGYFSDGQNDIAVVTRLMVPQAGEVIGTPHTVTITAEGAERMIARAWRSDPTLKAVGWGHTHPCFEAFFSGTDRTEQRVWREPASVGLVVSGLERPQRRYCVFVGPDSTPAERLDVPPATALTYPPSTATGTADTRPAATTPAPAIAALTIPAWQHAVPVATATTPPIQPGRRDPSNGFGQPDAVSVGSGFSRGSSHDGPKRRWRVPVSSPTTRRWILLVLVGVLIFGVVAWTAATSPVRHAAYGTAPDAQGRRAVSGDGSAPGTRRGDRGAAATEAVVAASTAIVAAAKPASAAAAKAAAAAPATAKGHEARKAAHSRPANATAHKTTHSHAANATTHTTTPAATSGEATAGGGAP